MQPSDVKWTKEALDKHYKYRMFPPPDGVEKFLKETYLDDAEKVFTIDDPKGITWIYHDGGVKAFCKPGKKVVMSEEVIRRQEKVMEHWEETKTLTKEFRPDITDEEYEEQVVKFKAMYEQYGNEETGEIDDGIIMGKDEVIMNEDVEVIESLDDVVLGDCLFTVKESLWDSEEATNFFLLLLHYRHSEVELDRPW
jgi:hypothetical protein